MGKEKALSICHVTSAEILSAFHWPIPRYLSIPEGVEHTCARSTRDGRRHLSRSLLIDATPNRLSPSYPHRRLVPFSLETNNGKEGIGSLTGACCIFNGMTSRLFASYDDSRIPMLVWRRELAKHRHTRGLLERDWEHSIPGFYSKQP